jgi:diacylglycerol kinase family enzyme
VSGDGILNEVINAIYHRKEKEPDFDIPVGVIPSGKKF